MNEKVLKEKKEVKTALSSAYDTVPQKIDYESKIFSFKDALNKLKDETVDASVKNQFLREIIDDITFEREKAIRLTKEIAKEMNVPYTHKLCFHNFPFSLDINIRG